MNDLSTIFQRELWTTEFVNMSSELTNILNSSIVTSSPDIDKMVNAVDAGTKILIPYVQEDLYSESEVMNDSAVGVTVNAITKTQAMAFIGFYSKSWGQKDIIKYVGSGLNAIDAAQSLVGRYWAKDIQAKIVAMLNGAYASNVKNNASDNVLVSLTEKFGYGVFVDTLAKAGDNMDNFGAIIVHSLTKAEILKNDANSITSVLDSNLGITRTMYNGLELIVNDSLPFIVDAVNGDRVASYVLRKGAVVFSQKDIEAPIALAKSETDGKGAGSTTVISRNGFLISLNGYSYTGVLQADVSPTNVELSFEDNWIRLVDAKQSPFLVLETLK